MINNFNVSKVAMLGSGVMGAQIAAHFANAGIPVVLFDLKSKEGPANKNIQTAILNLTKLSPKPIVSKSILNFISVANYDDNLEQLLDCDLIIEAIAERLDWKEALYTKIASFVKKGAIIASNTSGLSINKLAESLPESLRSSFCGIHFFNPPRYMPLVELIPHDKIGSEILHNLETFLVTGLGKSVVIAKDTPNFIANRLGIYSLLATCYHTEKFNLPLEIVDQLTGKELGRAKSATFRTADVVGLDIFANVANTMADNCKDGFEVLYTVPTWISSLIDAGVLGQKTKGGLYKKDKDGIKVMDLDSKQYRLSDKKISKEVADILKIRNWSDKLEALKKSNNAEAQFLWALFRDTFHYAACMLGEISDTPRSMDLAIRWGFGWKEGIFEIWQQAGWLKVASWIKDEIASGDTISQRPLPSWVFELKEGLYVDNKHFNIQAGKLVERQLLPVYSRQLFPDLVLNELSDTPRHVIYQNDGVTLWHTGDNIGILSFKSKMCSIGMEVLLGLEEAIQIAEQKCTAMVIWQEKDLFSVGANLEQIGFDIMMNGDSAIDKIIDTGHRVITQKLRYAKIPVVAAVKGYAFGGGCEILLHSTAVVAAVESYIGLVEAGVGILPGWGGSKEMALRASRSPDSWKDFEKRYKNIAMAQVSGSAHEALEMGFLRETDNIVMNSREILLVAKEKAKYLAIAGYRAPVKSKFSVFGEQGIATVKGLLANMLAGGQISEHDKWIATNTAYVMCGGDVTCGSEVTEDWMLKIEKQKFKELALSQKSQDRIQHMLESGKPLRN